MATRRIGREAWPLSVCAIALLAAALAASGPAGPPPARAQAEVLDLPVRVRGVARLYAAEIGLRYDPEQVTPIDAMPARPGIQLQAGEGWGGAAFVLVNELDPRTGRARFSATLLAPRPALAGDPVLLRLRFTPRRLEPEDAWGLTDVLLLDARGDELEADWQGLEIRPRVDWPSIRPRLVLPWLVRH